MKKAAIVIDEWKLPMFKKVLDSYNYEYSYEICSDETVVINVKTETVEEMYPIFTEAANAAMRSKMN